MLNIFITLLFLYNQIICINNYNEISEESEIIEIEPGLSQTYFIKYEKETNFKFLRIIYPPNLKKRTKLSRIKNHLSI